MVLSTLLVMVPWLVFAVLVAFVVVAPFAGRWLTTRPSLTAVLLGLSVVGVLGLTLYPDGDARSAVGCSLELPYLSPTAAESIANILLFVPVALFAGLLTRRPVMATLGVILMSAMIEVAQAVVLGIGRACDTSDLITNSVGAIVGGALVLVTRMLLRRREPARSRGE
jgi:hypothetical protein